MLGRDILTLAIQCVRLKTSGWTAGSQVWTLTSSIKMQILVGFSQ